MQYIELKQMTFFAYHGVMEQERKVGNTFTIDLTIGMDLSRAIASDKLDDTISYADVYQAVKEEMAIPSNLIEHAAGRILQRLKADFPVIQQLRIRLAKRNPPMGGDIVSAAVVLEEHY